MYLGIGEAIPGILLCLLLFVLIAVLNKIIWGYWFNK